MNPAQMLVLVDLLFISWLLLHYSLSVVVLLYAFYSCVYRLCLCLPVLIPPYLNCCPPMRNGFLSALECDCLEQVTFLPFAVIGRHVTPTH